MRPTRPAVLAVLAAASAVLCWPLLRAGYDSLPPFPWTAVPTILLLALGEAYTGQAIRARIQRRPGTRPVQPMSVARLAALAKASAGVGAVLVGVFGGAMLALGGELAKPTPRQDFIVSTATMVSALVLVAAALFLEYSCRVPRDPDEDRTTTVVPE